MSALGGAVPAWACQVSGSWLSLAPWAKFVVSACPSGSTTAGPLTRPGPASAASDQSDPPRPWVPEGKSPSISKPPTSWGPLRIARATEGPVGAEPATPRPRTIKAPAAKARQRRTKARCASCGPPTIDVPSAIPETHAAEALSRLPTAPPAVTGRGPDTGPGSVLPTVRRRTIRSAQHSRCPAMTAVLQTRYFGQLGAPHRGPATLGGPDPTDWRRRAAIHDPGGRPRGHRTGLPRGAGVGRAATRS